MKNISYVWTVIYKEEGFEPLAYSYTSEKDAVEVKQMVEGGNGGELVDEAGNFERCFILEWCYLVNGKLISSE